MEGKTWFIDIVFQATQREVESEFNNMITIYCGFVGKCHIWVYNIVSCELTHLKQPCVEWIP